MRVYDKRKGKIIETETDISEELMIKKTFLLPVETKVCNYEDTETPEQEEGIYVEEDKVIEVINEFYHVETLSEAKLRRKEKLRLTIEPLFPVWFKQNNAIMGLYSEEENQSIKDEVSKWLDYINTKEKEIDKLTSIKKVNEFEIKPEGE